jgi:hypothetical protein
MRIILVSRLWNQLKPVSRRHLWTDLVCVVVIACEFDNCLENCVIAVERINKREAVTRQSSLCNRKKGKIRKEDVVSEVELRKVLTEV